MHEITVAEYICTVSCSRYLLYVSRIVLYGGTVVHNTVPLFFDRGSWQMLRNFFQLAWILIISCTVLMGRKLFLVAETSTSIKYCYEGQT